MSNFTLMASPSFLNSTVKDIPPAQELAHPVPLKATPDLFRDKIQAPTPTVTATQHQTAQNWTNLLLTNSSPLRTPGVL